MTHKSSAQLHVFSTKEDLSEQVVDFIVTIATAATAQRGIFSLALSGGSMPKLLTPLIDRPQINWPDWHIFWADERCVPLNHPDSNFHLAQALIFTQVNLPQNQIYTIVEDQETDDVATAYQETLIQFFNPTTGQLPRFDLILLGMGEDGHTASLFPNHPLLNEKDRWVAPIFDSPKPPLERITLTLPVINNARQIAFLTTGAGKAEILPQVLNPTDESALLPAARVRPTSGGLHWFVDETAATGLTKR